jgi:hypothetical protein
MPRKSTHLCQRCRLPLVPHESISNLTTAQLNLLTARNGPDFGVPTDGRATITAGRGGEIVGAPGGSYILLTESLMAKSLMNVGDRDMGPTNGSDGTSSGRDLRTDTNERCQMS